MERNDKVSPKGERIRRWETDAIMRRSIKNEPETRKLT
jgi:hypothetical protein